MSTASKLTKLAQGLDSNGVLSAEKGGTGTTSGGAATVVAATAPVSPQTGSFWLNSDTGDLHVYAGGSWILIGSSGGGFSGSYLDLTDKPTIPTVSPSAISDQPNSSTGYFDLPAGTTAQRPVSATAGAMRLNTETNYLEIYNGTVWVQLQYAGAMVTATGGSVTMVGNYKLHTFTTSGSLVISSAPIGATIEVLTVGGGGGGSARHTGGGGAGGFRYNSLFSAVAGTYVVTVGAGGAGAGGSQQPDASSGSLSEIYLTSGGTGSGLQSAGGGGAGITPRTGGSGAGSSVPVAGAAGNVPATTPVQGYAGGTGTGSGAESTYTGGGGGGAGGAGANGNTNGTPGAGGIGAVNPIVGSILGESSTGAYYLAGGGGGGGSGGVAVNGLGGLGGGGRGGSSGDGVPGTVNTGGGGGSGGFSGGANYYGAAGGSGVVIVRYRYQ